MPIRNTLIVLMGTLAVGTALAASFDKKPPEGVKLSGTWRLDPQRSDDPAEVIQKAAANAKADREREIEGRRSACVDPWGREDNDTWGKPLPPTRMPGEERCRRDPFPDRGRDDPFGRGRDGTTIDPTGSGGSVVFSKGNANGNVRNEYLLQLDPSPDMLTILDSGSRVSVSENRLETDCSAGAAEPIADSFGDGERRCGWKGKAWIIETTRTKRFKRTDRFEMQKGGKTLLYTTTATGQQMPSIRISRIYEWVPPATSP